MSRTRWIYTYGQQASRRPRPVLQRHSVGHWEGDTLVIDTVGFSPETQIAPGLDHSDKMKIHRAARIPRHPEHADRRNDDHRSRGAGRPYVTRVAFKPDTVPLREYVCAENNRLTSDDQKGANIDLNLNGNPEPGRSVRAASPQAGGVSRRAPAKES